MSTVYGFGFDYRFLHVHTLYTSYKVHYSKTAQEYKDVEIYNSTQIRPDSIWYETISERSFLALIYEKRLRLCLSESFNFGIFRKAAELSTFFNKSSLNPVCGKQSKTLCDEDFYS